MKDSKWASEPWTMGIGVDGYTFYDADNEYIFNYPWRGTETPDRILDCVNACAGISNPKAIKELLDVARIIARDCAQTAEGRWLSDVIIKLQKGKP